MKLLSACLCLTFSATALAEPITAVPLDHNGQSGVWLPTRDAERLLDAAERLKAARDTVRLQDQVIDLQARMVNTSTRALGLAEQALDRSEQMNDILRDAYVREVERNNSIWSSPVLWFGLGALATGVAVGAGAYFATR